MKHVWHAHCRHEAHSTVAGQAQALEAKTCAAADLEASAVKRCEVEPRRKG